MANHRRGRAKNQRAGCLLCKPHKANGVRDEPMSVRRAPEIEYPDYDSWPYWDEMYDPPDDPTPLTATLSELLDRA